MSISVKQAYKYAKEVFSDYIITNCTELKDSWIFFADCPGKFLFIPPLEILKSGKDIDLWAKHREFTNVFEESDWLDEHGKNIPIEELEKADE